MADDDKTSNTGLWLTDDGKVVKKQPKGSATQLVRPGGQLTAAVQAQIDSLDADPDADPIPAHVALGNPAEVDTSDSGQIQAVSTDDLAPKKAPAKKASAATKKS
jgi:hypothetical protein